MSRQVYVVENAPGAKAGKRLANKEFTSVKAFEAYVSELRRLGVQVDHLNPFRARVPGQVLPTIAEFPPQRPRQPRQGQSGAGLVLPHPELRSSLLAARIVLLSAYLVKLQADRVQFEEERHMQCVDIDLRRLAGEYISAACVDWEAESRASRARASDLAAGRAERAPRGAERSAPRGPGGLTCK